MLIQLADIVRRLPVQQTSVAAAQFAATAARSTEQLAFSKFWMLVSVLIGRNLAKPAWHNSQIY